MSQFKEAWQNEIWENLVVAPLSEEEKQEMNKEGINWPKMDYELKRLDFIRKYYANSAKNLFESIK